MTLPLARPLDQKTTTLDELKRLGCDGEGSHLPKLCAVDVPPQVSYDSVLQFLNEGAARDVFDTSSADIDTPVATYHSIQEKTAGSSSNASWERSHLDRVLPASSVGRGPREHRPAVGEFRLFDAQSRGGLLSLVFVQLRRVCHARREHRGSSTRPGAGDVP
jgi:hypothetical protein